MFVKICGITNEDDALLAVAMGADAVGFVFAPSPRQVSAQVVYDITRRLPPEILTVGVFKDDLPDRIFDIVSKSGVKAVQLHGHEPVSTVAALAASAACWTASVALLALSTPEAAPFWLKAKYAFIAFTPVTVAWFALEFTGSMPLRRSWVLAALSAIPTLRLALLWTDEGRGWLIREIVFERTGSLNHVGRVVYGPLHPYAIAYNYLLIFGAVLLVLMWAARTGPLARPQGLALAGAAVAPVAANSATLLGITPPDMDPMPLALAVTGALICWSALR